MDGLDHILSSTTTNSATNSEALSMEAIQTAIEQAGPFPDRVTYIELNGERYPVKDFSLDLSPRELHIDEATGPDHTILTTWQHKQLIQSFEVKPTYMCNWGVLMDGTSVDGSPGKFIPYTLIELRALRKRMRDNKGKQLLKEIAQIPALCQQDPRKLKRLARNKAKQLQRLTGEKVSYTVHKARITSTDGPKGYDYYYPTANIPTFHNL